MTMLQHASAVSAVLLASAPVQAATTIDFSFIGTVQTILDPTGVFGTAKAGDSYTLVYHADFSRGRYARGGGGTGGGSSLFGGASQTGFPGDPTIMLSPVSATLTIDGHSIDFAGTYYGEAQYTYAGAAAPGQSSADFTAQDHLQNFGGPFDSVTTKLTAPTFHAFDVPLDQPVALAVDGNPVTRYSTFGYGLAVASGREPLVSGDLTPARYAATPAVPEPAVWSMLIAGFGMVGGIARRQRRLGSA